MNISQIRCGSSVEIASASSSGRSHLPARSSSSSPFSSSPCTSSRRKQHHLGVCHATTKNKYDPFRAAGQRLESLLAGVGDGEDELLNMMLMEESVDRKVFIAALAGTGIATASFVVCWLCGIDPVGGASLSLGSLKAAALGGAVALPFVVVKACLWTDSCYQYIPHMQDLQQRQVKEFEPILYQLSPAQTLLVMSSEVVPGLLILYPAAMGGIAKLLEFFFNSRDIAVPAALPAAISIVIVSLIVSVAKLAENLPDSEETDTIRDALDNADRFYRLVVGVDKDMSPKEAENNANAFRVVALTWMARRNLAAKAAANLCFLEVLFLGGLWQWTDDFAASLVAGIALAAVDFGGILKSMPEAQGGGGGSSTPGPSAL